uniref:Uncharacterized protein n=1 Tax=Schizaphis graminum TaxID=13262 RepID=A0A2S2PT62_SCHGA
MSPFVGHINYFLKDLYLQNSTVNKPQNAIKTLPYCTDVVPNIKFLLQIFTALPVTTITLKCNFSTLKLLKTYLRSSMTENRLNRLGLVNINKKRSFHKPNNH